MASKLPFEIIQDILHNLPIEEKIECSLVCKPWSIPAQQSMWNSIQFDRQDEFDRICSPATDSNNPYYNGGQYTRKLEIKGITINDEQLYVLQRYFRNIHCLNIDLNHMKVCLPTESTNWDLWRQLKELRIYVSLVEDENTINYFLSALTYLPCLRLLEISDSKKDKRVSLDIAYFETLHGHLPNLETLSISIKFITLTAEDIMSIPSLSSAKYIKSLEIDIESLDFRWLCYFSVKYPNLSHLKWVTNLDCRSGLVHNEESDFSLQFNSEYYYDQAMELFERLPWVFPQLTKAYIRNTEYSHQEQLIFWDIVHKFKVPIKNLDYAFCYLQGTRSSLQKIIKQSTFSSPNTIERINIARSIEFGGFSAFTTEFDYCPRLVEITFTYCDIQIEADTLLNNCVALKKVRVTSGTFKLGNNAGNNMKPHGLKILIINHGKVYYTVFNFLSLRCKDLNFLRLDNTKIFAPISKLAGCIHIDMSHSHFKLLHFYNVNFSPSDDILSFRKVIHLTALSQRTTSSHIKNPNEYESTSISGGIRLQGTTPIWIHEYYNSSPENSQQFSMRILNEEEGKYAQDFFTDYQNNKKLQTTKGIRTPRGHMPLEYWKADLQEGYVSLDCGFIDRYYFGYKTPEYQKHWENIYKGIN